MAASGGGSPSTAAPPPMLTVAAVARRLGVAPSTLRTWDRRYRLGPSAHVAGSHRRYTASDVSRLASMRRLTMEGVPPADAARLVQAEPVDVVPAADPAQLAAVVRFHQVAQDRTPEPGPAGGGRVVALPAGSPQARGLARAAMGLDSLAMARLLQEALERHGVQETWTAMAMPVLRAVGERWSATGEGIDVEHVFSEVLIGVLRSFTARTGVVERTPPVLLGCVEGDYHSVPLHVLCAALAEHGVPCRVLGSGLPARALSSAVRRTGPSVVFLYAQMPAPDPAVLGELPRQRPIPRVLVGGTGWDGVRLPSSTRKVSSLAEAVEETLLAVAP